MSAPPTPSRRIQVLNQAHQDHWLTDTKAGQEILAQAYRDQEKALCLCMPGGAPLYIGRRKTTYYLARYPGTGQLHADDCPSVESTYLYTGAPWYLPETITEGPDGRLRVAPLASPATKSNPSMKGLLDLILDHGNLNALHPGDAHSWVDARKSLLLSVQDIELEGVGNLGAATLIPDRYEKTEAAELSINAANFLKSEEPRFILAALKEIRPTRYGWQIVLRNLPGFRFWLNKRVADAFLDRYNGTLQLEAPPAYALCLLRAHPNKAGDYIVSDLAITPTDRRYLPVGTEIEGAVSVSLVDRGYAIARPLRYDLPWEEVTADFMVIRNNGGLVPVFVLADSGCLSMDTNKRESAMMLVRHDAPVAVFDDGKWLRPPPSIGT